jgi:hypothetical protein
VIPRRRSFQQSEQRGPLQFNKASKQGNQTGQSNRAIKQGNQTGQSNRAIKQNDQSHQAGGWQSG